MPSVSNFTLQAYGSVTPPVAIKHPHSYSISDFILTRAARTADGTMNAEIIAAKRKFEFKYQVIKKSEKETILNLLNGGSFFFNLGYIEDGTSKSLIVYRGESKFDYFRQYYWKDFEFNLIER